MNLAEQPNAVSGGSTAAWVTTWTDVVRGTTSPGRAFRDRAPAEDLAAALRALPEIEDVTCAWRTDLAIDKLYERFVAGVGVEISPGIVSAARRGGGTVYLVIRPESLKSPVLPGFDINDDTSLDFVPRYIQPLREGLCEKLETVCDAIDAAEPDATIIVGDWAV